MSADDRSAKFCIVGAGSSGLAAAKALAEGRPLEAAAIYEDIGARPDEALARLRSVPLLRASGAADRASQQLERALDFYRSVGADPGET